LKEGNKLRTPSDDGSLDYPDRTFHVEVLRGGMNRLLLRSNRTAQSGLRIEIFFMNVAHMSIGTTFEGLSIRDVTDEAPWDDEVWHVRTARERRVFELTSRSGSGRVLAAAVAADESNLGPADPSAFFMMD